MLGGTGNYYTIQHIVLITGLTDRTIRGYLATGLLEGEKINGLWHFTPEQVETFLRHPAVRPSILAKNNAIIYDFLAEDRKQDAEMCVILDLPGDNPKRIAEFFCYTISTGDFHDFRFAFDSAGGTPRVILKGDPQQIRALLDQYYAQ